MLVVITSTVITSRLTNHFFSLLFPTLLSIENIMSCTSATYDSTTTPQKCRSIRKLLIQKYLYNNFNLEISNLENRCVPLSFRCMSSLKNSGFISSSQFDYSNIFTPYSKLYLGFHQFYLYALFDR